MSFDPEKDLDTGGYLLFLLASFVGKSLIRLGIVLLALKIYFG